MSRPRPPTGSRAPPPSPPFSAAAPPYSKYGNRKTEVDGITFASRKEARRYGALKLLERGKVIRDLRCQPVYPLTIGGIKVGKYIGDFAFTEKGREVCEDTKGMRTAVFNLKWRIVKALYPDIDWRLV